MKAVAYQKSLPISDPASLLDVHLPVPQLGSHDLLVEVKAIAVNPVDTKVRKNTAPADGEYKVLGWDAAGVVISTGDAVSLFAPGDRVFYAGAIGRAGSNAEQQVVDERIVGRMPNSLGFAEAAALPLTSITAWELLFDRLQVPRIQSDTEIIQRHEAILIIGAAGGVGSILTQLARQLTDLTVIGTASRAESQAWVKALGAHHVIDHHQPLSESLKEIGIPSVRYVAGLTQTDQHLLQIAELIAPQGRFALIDDPAQLNVSLFKRKSVSIHWEFMFTRAAFETADMVEQHHLLNEVAALIDAKVLRTTMAEHFGLINAANLKRAHALLESGQSRGKIVLEGF